MKKEDKYFVTDFGSHVLVIARDLTKAAADQKEAT
jgi:hypothetical protein